MAAGQREQHLRGLRTLGGAKKCVVCPEVIDEPCGEEQRAWQRPQGLGIGGVKRIASAQHVLVVNRVRRAFVVRGPPERFETREMLSCRHSSFSLDTHSRAGLERLLRDAMRYFEACF